MDSNEVNVKVFGLDDFDSEKKMVSLSLEEFQALEKIPNSSKAADKMRYDKPVNLTIEKVTVSRTAVTESSKEGDSFVTYRVNLHYSDGGIEGLGGFRGYLDSNGKPDRFWSTEKSAGGKIKRMLEGFLELKEPMSFYQFASNLQGMKVRVRSEDWAVNGQKGFKNIPIEFLSKES